MLFVGTKKQAQEPIQSEAERSGMPYVNNRWLGGMLTNFVTMRGRVTRMEELEAMDADGRMATLPKKEQLLLRKELGKLQANLNGVRDMRELPSAIFVSTPSVRTSRSTRRSVCASRSSASSTRTPIPTTSTTSSRATTTRSARSALMCRVIADAVIEGRGGMTSTAADRRRDPVPTVVSQRVRRDRSPLQSSRLSRKPLVG